MHSTARLVAAVAATVLGVWPGVAHAQSVFPACRISGRATSLRSVVVRPPGEPTMSFDTERLPTRARLLASPDRADVEVNGTLTFSGEVRAVPIALSRDVDLAHGALHAAPDATILRARSFQDGARANVRIDTRVTFANIPIPCDALTLDAQTPRRTTARRPAVSGDGTFWVPRGSQLRMRVTVHGTVLRARVVEPEMVSLARLGTRGGLWFVAYEGMSGSWFRGWVHRSELRPMPLGSYGSIGTTGVGRCGIAHHDGPTVYLGPAVIEPGTTVFARAGVGPWGQIGGDGRVIVWSELGQPWVAVRRVEGVSEVGACSEILHAWVPRAAVRIDDPRGVAHSGVTPAPRAP